MIKKASFFFLLLFISYGLGKYFTYRYQIREDAFTHKSKTIQEIIEKRATTLLWSGVLREKSVPNNGKQKLAMKAHSLQYRIKGEKRPYQIALRDFVVWFEVRFKTESLRKGEMLEISIPSKYLTLTKDVNSSYGHYLKGKEVIAKGFLFSPNQVKEINENDLNFSRRYLLAIGFLQREVYETFQKYLGMEAYGLSYALLTGDKGGIAYESKEIFRITGVYHVLAVSGMHAGILTVVFFSLFRLANMRRDWAMGSILLVILPTYMCIADFQISLIRTYFMLMAAFLLKLIDRKTEPVLIVLFTLMVSILVDPSLVKNISFQLSYGAVIGIMLALKLINQYKIKHWIWQYVFVSIGAQSFTLPFVLFYFGYFNYLSLFYSFPISILLGFSLLLSIILALDPGSVLSQWVGEATRANNLFSIKLLDWTYLELDSFSFIKAGDLNTAVMTSIVVSFLWWVVIHFKKIAKKTENLS